MIDWVCIGRIVFLEFEFHGPLNCPLLYLSNYFKGSTAPWGFPTVMNEGVEEPMG